MLKSRLLVSLFVLPLAVAAATSCKQRREGARVKDDTDPPETALSDQTKTVTESMIDIDATPEYEVPDRPDEEDLMYGAEEVYLGSTLADEDPNNDVALVNEAQSYGMGGLPDEDMTNVARKPAEGETPEAIPTAAPEVAQVEPPSEGAQGDEGTTAEEGPVDFAQFPMPQDGLSLTGAATPKSISEVTGLGLLNAKKLHHFAEIANISYDMAQVVARENNQTVITQHVGRTLGYNRSAGFFVTESWRRLMGVNFPVTERVRYAMMCDDASFTLGIAGTEAGSNPASVLSDLRFGAARPRGGDARSGEPGSGYMHAGFLSAANAIYAVVKKHINDTGSSRKKIYVAGHSLGGAIGMVVAYRLKRDGYDLQGLYTWGAPMVGDAAWMTKINDTIGNVTVQTFNPGDPVPRVAGTISISTPSLLSVVGGGIRLTSWNYRPSASSYATNAFSSSNCGYSGRGAPTGLSTNITSARSIVITAAIAVATASNHSMVNYRDNYNTGTCLN